MFCQGSRSKLYHSCYGGIHAQELHKNIHHHKDEGTRMPGADEVKNCPATAKPQQCTAAPEQHFMFNSSEAEYTYSAADICTCPTPLPDTLQMQQAMLVGPCTKNPAGFHHGSFVHCNVDPLPQPPWLHCMACKLQQDYTTA